MIELKNVSLTYPASSHFALENINLSIAKGEFVYLVGHSGAGKSSLLNLLLKRSVPSSGQILIAGESLAKYRGERIALHRRRIGMVFQDNLLLPHLNVYDNVAFALRVTDVPARDWNTKVMGILEPLGMADKIKSFPMQLSQGEQQRIAIARAMVSNPVLLLADEPTGNLDPETSQDILAAIYNINVRGTTIIMATHARELVEQYRKRTITLRHGQIVRDDPNGGYLL